MKRRGTVAITTVVIMVIASPALAHASRMRTVHFTARFTDPGDEVTAGGVDPKCPPGKIAVRGTAYLQAPMRTVDTSHGCVYYDPVAQLDALRSNEAPAVVVSGYLNDHQVGALDGCGTGSFTMHLTDFRITSVDLVGRTFSGNLMWVVVQGSGTGAFRDAAGKGTASGTYTSPTLTAPPTLPNFGSFQGTITCPGQP
jgi:hypothetical protein